MKPSQQPMTPQDRRALYFAIFALTIAGVLALIYLVPQR